MTWIKTAETTFTSQTSVSIDNCFSARYKHYLVQGNFSGTANDVIFVRLRASGSDASGADYRWQNWYGDGSSFLASRVLGSTNMNQGLGRVESTTSGFRQLLFSNPYDAVSTTAWADYTQTPSGNIIFVRGVYSHDLATSYDGFTGTSNSDPITGTIRVYGLRES